MDGDNTNQDEGATVSPPEDVVVNFLSRLKFSDNIVDQLITAERDDEVYAKFFKIPDILVYWNAYINLAWDTPDRDSKENEAFRNLIRWLMIKMATHPYWFQRIGWFNRFVSGHTNPKSYYPIAWHPFFLPSNWKSMDGDWNPKQINDELKPDFQSVFDWNAADKKFEDLERSMGIDWIDQKVREKKGQ